MTGIDIAIAIFLVTLFFAITIHILMDLGYAREIYLIWYLNCFFFVLLFGMGLIAEKKNVHLTAVCGSYESTCHFVYDMLTNINDELALLGAIFVLAVIPQLMTYFISGVFGAATAPKFIGETITFVIWCFIKFSAGLGGILNAEPFVKMVVGKPVSYRDLGPGLLYTAVPFILAGTYAWWRKDMPMVVDHHFGDKSESPLRRMHILFTRNVPEEPKLAAHSFERKALIELLKSDAVFDYVERESQNTKPLSQHEPAKVSNEAVQTAKDIGTTP
jgi:hypothetical protein